LSSTATWEGVGSSAGVLVLATRLNGAVEWRQVGDVGTVKWGPSDSRTSDDERGRWWSELVFAARPGGGHVDAPRLRGALEAALLRDEEMVLRTAWGGLEDPFEAWLPREEDDG